MSDSPEIINILVIARWPLGGIRTYFRYMFKHFPDKFNLTILAPSTAESDALIVDVKEFNGRLFLVNENGTLKFAFSIFRHLVKNNYHLILSQGFVSALATFPGNLFFKIPHILTIHGIVEPQFFSGHLGFLKRKLFGRILSKVSILYGVSNDILDHLFQAYPYLRHGGPQPLVIYNGIELVSNDLNHDLSQNLRETFSIDSNIFIFGFFGRFMNQKGFDLLIEAVDLLVKDKQYRKFVVIAVGSGDFLREYQIIINDKNLNQYFYFLPFQPKAHLLFSQIDAIVMPSRWEASPLLAMEALCVGTPLIASDCIGLRETIKNTPSFIFRSENVSSLCQTMKSCLSNSRKEMFNSFVPKARKRFAAVNSASSLINHIETLLNLK